MTANKETTGTLAVWDAKTGEAFNEATPMVKFDGCGWQFGDCAYGLADHFHALAIADGYVETCPYAIEAGVIEAGAQRYWQWEQAVCKELDAGKVNGETDGIIWAIRIDNEDDALRLN